MSRMWTVVLAVALQLVGCAQTDDTGGQPAGNGFYASDAGLSCNQILGEITHENMVIKQANTASAQSSSTGLLNGAGNGSPVSQVQGASPDFAPTSSGETSAQLAADQTGTGAVARANALVTLGRQKKCFK